jgi:Spy/CpxP family protein refolding chaperone
MKSFVKVLISVLALGVMASAPMLRAQEDKAAPAEGKKGGGGRGGMLTVERIEEVVGALSADQKTKIAALLAKSQKDMEAIPQEERREKGREIMTTLRKDVAALLTAEQKAKFDAMPQGGRGPGGGGGGGKKKQN